MPHPGRVPLILTQGPTSEKPVLRPEKDWPIPPTPTATPAPPIKMETAPQVAAISHVMVMPKQATEKCSWGLHCPICKNKEEHEEDWDGNMLNQARMCPQNTHCPLPQTLQHPQPQNNQYPETQNFQHLQLQNSQQSFDIPDRYAKQIKL